MEEARSSFDTCLRRERLPDARRGRRAARQPIKGAASPGGAASRSSAAADFGKPGSASTEPQPSSLPSCLCSVALPVRRRRGLAQSSTREAGFV